VHAYAYVEQTTESKGLSRHREAGRSRVSAPRLPACVQFV
jgi:hypothetical protein